MYVCKNVGVYVRMNVRIYGCMYVCMNVLCIYAYMYLRVYVYISIVIMYLYIYIYLCLRIYVSKYMCVFI